MILAIVIKSIQEDSQVLIVCDILEGVVDGDTSKKFVQNLRSGMYCVICIVGMMRMNMVHKIIHHCNFTLLVRYVKSKPVFKMTQRVYNKMLLQQKFQKLFCNPLLPYMYTASLCDRCLG